MKHVSLTGVSKYPGWLWNNLSTMKLLCRVGDDVITNGATFGHHHCLVNLGKWGIIVKLSTVKPSEST